MRSSKRLAALVHPMFELRLPGCSPRGTRVILVRSRMLCLPPFTPLSRYSWGSRAARRREIRIGVDRQISLTLVVNPLFDCAPSCAIRTPTPLLRVDSGHTGRTGPSTIAALTVDDLWHLLDHLILRNATSRRSRPHAQTYRVGLQPP